MKCFGDWEGGSGMSFCFAETEPRAHVENWEEKTSQIDYFFEVDFTVLP